MLIPLPKNREGGRENRGVSVNMIWVENYFIEMSRTTIINSLPVYIFMVTNIIINNNNEMIYGKEKCQGG